MSSQPTMRIGGLGSGFDVGGTIEQLMEIESRRVEKLQTEQELRNDKITAWIDVKENLSGLTRAADRLRWMDVWRGMVADSTNPSVLNATAATHAAHGTYAIEVTHLARAHTIASASGLADTHGHAVTAETKLVDIDGVEAGSQFTIAGQSFTISSSDTLKTLRDKINAKTAEMPQDHQVSATILDNRLVLQRVNTGSDSILISDSTGFPLAALGVLDGSGDPANELLVGQDAVFSVNGATVTRSANTALSDVIEGVTLNLEGIGSSQLSIGRDTAAVKEAIHEFVEAYNTAAEVIEFYGTWDRSDPAMPTPGMLQSDSMIREMLYKLRGLAGQMMGATHTAANASYTYNGQQGVMNSLQHVGIWTQGEANRLAVIDETRLDALLDQEFEKVENLFRGVPSETRSGVRDGGIAQSMYRGARNYSSELDGWIDFRIERIDEEINRQDARIERMIRELEAKEAMLWRQFGAMDEAIGRMQSGFEYLMGQIGSPISRQGR